jgi:hypothetical protein
LAYLGNEEGYDGCTQTGQVEVLTGRDDGTQGVSPKETGLSTPTGRQTFFWVPLALPVGATTTTNNTPTRERTAHIPYVSILLGQKDTFLTTSRGDGDYDDDDDDDTLFHSQSK